MSKTLSSEHVFNESTPMMFSDSRIGAAIIMVFQVEDSSSRGHIRKYGLISLCEDETTLANSWSIIVSRMNKIIKSIKQKAEKESDRLDSKKSGHERYLRIRDIKQSSKSLATIVKDDRLFIEIHARFTEILSTLNKTIN